VHDASVNLMGLLNVLECGMRTGVRKVVVYAASGGTLYGEPRNLPIRESALGGSRPLSPYGISKKVAIEYLSFYELYRGVASTGLALADVYCPRQDPHGEAGVVAIFASKILAGETPTIFGDGNQTRDYVFVDDAVHAFGLAAERGDGRVVNVGTGVEMSVNGLWRLLADITGAAQRAGSVARRQCARVEAVDAPRRRARRNGGLPSGGLRLRARAKQAADLLVDRRGGPAGGGGQDLEVRGSDRHRLGLGLGFGLTPELEDLLDERGEHPPLGTSDRGRPDDVDDELGAAFPRADRAGEKPVRLHPVQRRELAEPLQGDAPLGPLVARERGRLEAPAGKAGGLAQRESALSASSPERSADLCRQMLQSPVPPAGPSPGERGPPKVGQIQTV